jgi:hypothetical protein
MESGRALRRHRAGHARERVMIETYDFIRARSKA